MTDSKDTAQRLSDLESRLERIEQLLTGSAVAHTNKQKPMSAKEFLQTKKITSDTQKAVALGYFLEHLGGMESFNVADLEAAFRSAKEKVPKNMNDAVNKNIARGFIDEASEKKDSKKAWYLTSTGERYVENELAS